MPLLPDIMVSLEGRWVGTEVSVPGPSYLHQAARSVKYRLDLNNGAEHNRSDLLLLRGRDGVCSAGGGGSSPFVHHRAMPRHNASPGASQRVQHQYLR